GGGGWRFPATGPLAHPAPGDEREVGSEQTLGRRVHPLDHHLVLVGEQYLVQPADVRPVAHPEQPSRQARRELHRQLHVSMVVLVLRHEPGVDREVELVHPQHAGQPNSDLRAAPTLLLPPALRRPPAQPGILRLAMDLGRVIGEPLAVFQHLHARPRPAGDLLPHEPRRVLVQVPRVRFVEAVLGGVPPVALANRDAAPLVWGWASSSSGMSASTGGGSRSPMYTQTMPMRSSTGYVRTRTLPQI